MRFVAISALLVLFTLSAKAEEAVNGAATPVAAHEGTEVVTPLAQEAAQELFSRIRGAYVRAAQQGKIALVTGASGKH